jgi:hypothetical protein
MLRVSFVSLVAAAAVSVPAIVVAAPIVIEFSVLSSIGKPTTGFGSVVTDDSNLAPGTATLDPGDLLDMTMTLTNIPSTQATTAFRRELLNVTRPWVLTIDDAGVIVDLNFFMRHERPNADNYSIEGFGPFNFNLCLGDAETNACAVKVGNSETDKLIIRIDQIRPAGPGVPEPATLGLVGVALIAGARLHRRARQ